MPQCKRAPVWILLIAMTVLARFPVDAQTPTSNYFNVAPAISAPGQFVEFNWNVNQAKSFTVTPSMLSEDESVLPLSASKYIQVAPAVSTVFTGMASDSSQPLTAKLTVVPVTLSVPASSVAAGQTAVLSFKGPNNGSSFFLTVLPENTTIPLTPDSCSGSTCTGSYLTAPLGSSRTFMVGAAGPRGGQAYSQAVAVNVSGGMTLSCAATPTVPTPGQPVTIQWSSSNAVSIRLDNGIGEVAPAASGIIKVRPTQTTTYTCTATDRFGDHLSAPAKVTISNGDVSNLNHIIYMLQENRAFDNYFGNLAYYRVYVDQIPGAQMSDVTDLHDLPSGFTLQNPQGQAIPPFHERTECIEGLNPNWNESHVDMDLVGGNWMSLTSNSQFLMDKFLFNEIGRAHV